MITFDPATHEYRDGDTVLPSVTQTLKAAGLIDTRFMRRSARDRGTRIHQVTAMIDRGEMTLPELYEPPIAAYVVGWEIWKHMAEALIVGVEMIVGSRELQYAGTLDRLVLQGGDTWVIDLKTGSPCSWHGLQLAAYALALGIPCRRGAVYLKECDPRFREYSDPGDFEGFLAALRLVQARRRVSDRGAI